MREHGRRDSLAAQNPNPWYSMKNMDNSVPGGPRLSRADTEFAGFFFNKTRFTNILTPLSRMG